MIEPYKKEPDKAEQELADKIAPLIKEITELDFRRGNGITLKKNDYIGDRQRELEAQIAQLKKPNHDTR